MLNQSLSHLKVVELANVLAGPAVGMFFAELGAQVIKVENRSSGGDMTRKWKLPVEDAASPLSAYFSSVNYAKHYVDVDLKTDSGLASLFSLLSDADVLIDNLKPSSKNQMGLSAEKLKEEFPQLIQASLKGFAEDDERVAFDVVLQAETGYLSMTGTDAELAKLPVAFIDLFAAHQLKEAILLALYLRERNGSGCIIHTSLEEAALSSLANQASNHLMTGHIPSRMGTLHPNIAPYGELVTSSDGKTFVLAVGTDAQFKSLCNILAIEQDDAFATNTSRIANRARLHQEINEALQSITGGEFFDACKRERVPIGRVKNLDEVLADKTSQDLLRTETIENKYTQRLATVVFHIQEN